MGRSLPDNVEVTMYIEGLTQQLLFSKSTTFYLRITLLVTKHVGEIRKVQWFNFRGGIDMGTNIAKGFRDFAEIFQLILPKL